MRKHNVEDIIACAQSYPEGTRLAVVAPVVLPEGRDLKTQLEIYRSAGYSRMYSKGEFVEIDDMLADSRLAKKKVSDIRLLIDRLAVVAEGDELSRLADSTETAMFEGDGACELIVWANARKPVTHRFSNRFEADGITFAEPSDQLFNFNNPIGACPTCEGFGRAVGIDERLVIPNMARSVYDDAVACWRGDKMCEWKRAFIASASRHGFRIHAPYCELTDAERDLLWHGAPDVNGIDAFFRMVE